MSEISLSRRRVLGGSLALGLSTLIPPALSPSVAATHRVPGIQLYTLRAAMAMDVPGTLQAVAGIGYKEVEFAGYFDQSPQQVRRLLDDLGLVSPSAHVDAHDMHNNPEPLINAAKTIGHDYLTVAWLESKDRQSIDDYKRWADSFNRAGELCRQNGLRLAYHNHEFEFCHYKARSRSKYY